MPEAIGDIGNEKSAASFGNRGTVTYFTFIFSYNYDQTEISGNVIVKEI